MGLKKEWHINKADLLHDIICMANNPSLHDGFTVIGINEETDFSVCDVVNDPNRRKTQDMVTFLRDKKFAGGIRPTVYVQSLSIAQKTIDVIMVQNEQNTQSFDPNPIVSHTIMSLYWHFGNFCVKGNPNR